MPNKPPRKTYKLIFASCFAALVTLVTFSYQDLLNWYQGYKIIWIYPKIESTIINDRGQTIIHHQYFKETKYRKKSLFNANDLSFQEFSSNDPKLPYSHPTSINSKGFIAGTITQELHWPQNSNAVIWKGSTPVEVISISDKRIYYPNDINDSNEVVGYSYKPIRRKNSYHFTQEKGFYWSKKKGIVELSDLLNVESSMASRINNHGVIIGHIYKQNSLKSYYIEGEKILFINCANTEYKDESVIATDLNNKGEVLIQHFDFSINTNPKKHFFGIWTRQGGFKKIATPKNIQVTVALNINDQGQILLEASNDSIKSFYIYDTETFIRLPDFNSNPTLSYLTLANNGWLTGYIKDPDNSEHKGFILKLLR